MTNAGASMHLRVPRIVDTGGLGMWLWYGQNDTILKWIRRNRILLTDICTCHEDGERIFRHIVDSGNYKLVWSLIERGLCTEIDGRSLPWIVRRTIRAQRYARSRVHDNTEELRCLRRILETDEEDDVVASTIIHDSIRGTLCMDLEDAIAACPSDLNTLDEGGLAPLHWAIFMDDLEAVHVLMRHSASVDIHSEPDRMTPLHYAACSNSTGKAVITVLLEYGAHLDARDLYGHTALHLAAYDVDKVRILLDAGAMPNSTDNWGQSPLCQWTSLDGAEVPSLSELLRAGADINLGDHDGNTPLLFKPGTMANAGLASFLIRNGASIHQVNKAGQSILHSIACLMSLVSGREPITRFLRTFQLQGLNPDARDSSGDSPSKSLAWQAANRWNGFPWNATESRIFEFFALIFEIRCRNWHSGLFLDSQAELMADGSHNRLRNWLGWQWQRLHDDPELEGSPWECLSCGTGKLEPVDTPPNPRWPCHPQLCIWKDSFFDAADDFDNYDIGILFENSQDQLEDSAGTAMMDDCDERDDLDAGEFVDALEY
ncbi:ankyrin repeat-containing domain protein [Cercophora scortea]|uniref:Ankyrin repeat-containing domain protein n=1 Tax=Cercophora scortea TaxID=314031 RepID=A0AAE0I2U0_9PEZI|nr:ankyrin repeat-containing domain protein [Cercophora scortea]